MNELVCCQRKNKTKFYYVLVVKAICLNKPVNGKLYLR